MPSCRGRAATTGLRLRGRISLLGRLEAWLVRVGPCPSDIFDPSDLESKGEALSSGSPESQLNSPFPSLRLPASSAQAITFEQHYFQVPIQRIPALTASTTPLCVGPFHVNPSYSDLPALPRAHTCANAARLNHHDHFGSGTRGWRSFPTPSRDGEALVESVWCEAPGTRDPPRRAAGKPWHARHAVSGMVSNILKGPTPAHAPSASSAPLHP